MITHFNITNFRSIQKMEIDFTFAEGKAPNGYREMPYHPFLSDKNIRTVPCLALYGANASGKTNIIKAFWTLQEILGKGLTANLHNPNVLQDCDETTIFEIIFSFNGQVFNYTLAYNDTHITREVLKCDEVLVFSIFEKVIDFTHISTAEYTQKMLKKFHSVESLDKNEHFKKPFLSVMGKNYAPLNTKVTDAYTYLTTKLEIHLNNELPLEKAMRNLADMENNQEIDDAFQRIVALLKTLDIGISRIEYDRKELHKFPLKLTRGAEYYIEKEAAKLIETKMKSYHFNHANEEIALSFFEESLGTRKLTPLIALILHVLDDGLVLIIDELECSIHPLLLAELLRLFKDKRYNKHNAQLIFTTHNTDVMDHELMRVSEIGIVNKTKKYGSRIVRISDFDDTRNVTRFRKQYLSGTFSGIPFPYI